MGQSTETGPDERLAELWQYSALRGGSVNHVDIFDHRDYHAFLAEWFEANKGRPSMRSFAKRAGCSVGLVSEVTRGRRRLDSKWIEAFAGVLDLTDQEREHFALMVELERSPNDGVRDTLQRRLAEAQGFRASRRFDEEALVLLRHWQFAALVELAGIQGFREDPAWIRARLRQEISVAEVQEALELLQRFGRLVRVDGCLQPQDDLPWVTEHEVQRAQVASAVRQRNQEILTLSGESLRRDPADERHFSTMTLPASKKTLPRLREAINAFNEAVIAIAMEGAAEAEEVYELNVQLIPLTSPVDDP